MPVKEFYVYIIMYNVIYNVDHHLESVVTNSFIPYRRKKTGEKWLILDVSD